jgi:photosystem II stability/assembly factor-like uncharacterized protein
MAPSSALRSQRYCINLGHQLIVQATAASTRPVALSLALLGLLSTGTAHGHDPSAFGGLFRSRDYGATWMSANQGAFLSGAIALAISPTDHNHLLLGTESGLFASHNGGRDWNVEAPSLILGSVFALSFSKDGQRALASTGAGLFSYGADHSWHESQAPWGALPCRTIVRGGQSGRFYLAGNSGLFRSDDGGASWSSAGNGLPEQLATALLVTQTDPEALYAVVQGRVWGSFDGARNWASRGAAIFRSSIDALATEPSHSGRIWAAGRDRLFKSDDGGVRWQEFGKPLPETNTKVHGIAASDEAVVLATDRGVYRSIDNGENWTLAGENVPAHLEAGPLVRDPVDSASLYAGFSLLPYQEIWHRSANQRPALAQVSVTSLIAGAALLIVLLAGGIGALLHLGRYYRPGDRIDLPARTVRSSQPYGTRVR